MTKKRFFTVLLALVTAFVLTASLAACGKDKTVAKPPTDEGQVASETQIALEGTYRTTETPPTGLGTELTFTADGKVTDNTGDGAGTYKIEGDKLAIEYQGVRSAYAFESDGHTVVLDGVKYIFVDETETSDEVQIPGDPSSEWYGLVLRFEGSNSREVPSVAVVDRELYTQYLKDALVYRSNVPHFVEPDYPPKFEDLDDDQTEVSLTFFSRFCCENLGVVLQYSPGGLCFIAPDGKELTTVNGEEYLYYSVTLNRVVTYQEEETDVKLSPGEAGRRYPDKSFTPGV